MSDFRVLDVNGFCKEQVSVSLSSHAAVYAAEGFLFRVDPQWNTLRTRADNITQTAQTAGEVLALAQRPGEEASLLCFDHTLRLLERRPLRLPDPQDGPGLCALTPETLYRLSFQHARPSEDPNAPGTADALFLDRQDLRTGAVRRRTVTSHEMEVLLAGDMEFRHFLTPCALSLWVHASQAYLALEVSSAPDCWDGRTRRPIVLQIDTDTGEIELLWHDALYNVVPDDHACRPCFFDFDRDILWTRPRKEPEAGAPFAIRPAPALPLVPRPICPNGFILEDEPAWAAVPDSCGWFDGRRALSLICSNTLELLRPNGSRTKRPLPEGVLPAASAPLVLWQDRVLLQPKGRTAPLSLPLLPAASADWKPLLCQDV